MFKIGWDRARCGEPDAESRPLSVVERSPDEGKRRRITDEAIETATEIMGDGHDYESSGFVYKGAMGIMKHDNAARVSTMKLGFESAGVDRGESQRSHLGHFEGGADDRRGEQVREEVHDEE